MRTPEVRTKKFEEERIEVALGWGVQRQKADAGKHMD